VARLQPVAPVPAMTVTLFGAISVTAYTTLATLSAMNTALSGSDT